MISEISLVFAISDANLSWLFRTYLLAPCSSNMITMFLCPPLDALCNGVLPVPYYDRRVWIIESIMRVKFKQDSDLHLPGRWRCNLGQDIAVLCAPFPEDTLSVVLVHLCLSCFYSFVSLTIMLNHNSSSQITSIISVVPCNGHFIFLSPFLSWTLQFPAPPLQTNSQRSQTVSCSDPQQHQQFVISIVSKSPAPPKP